MNETIIKTRRIVDYLNKLLEIDPMLAASLFSTGFRCAEQTPAALQIDPMKLPTGETVISFMAMLNRLVALATPPNSCDHCSTELEGDMIIVPKIGQNGALDSFQLVSLTALNDPSVTFIWDQPKNKNNKEENDE